MAEETNKIPAATEAQTKALAIQAYYDAKTREQKAAAVKQYPILKTVFSDANHS